MDESLDKTDVALAAEAIRRRYEPTLEGGFDLEISLIVASDEDISHYEEQRCIRAIDSDIRSLHHNVDTKHNISFGGSSHQWLSGDFFIHIGGISIFVKVMAKPFIPVMNEWIKGRSGRKIKLRRGNIEIEAQTIKEIERAWKLISDYQDSESL